MRTSSFFLIVLILIGCSKEKISVSDGDWGRYIYETSDIGVVSINSSSNPMVVFRNNFYEVLSGEGILIPSFRDSEREFDFFASELIKPLGLDNKFVFGSIDYSQAEPVYGIKLMELDSDPLVYFHNGIENGIFVRGVKNGFYGILKSPEYIDQAGNLNTDLVVVDYTYKGNVLDTLSTDTLSIQNLSNSDNVSFEGVVDGTQLFFILDNSLYSFDGESGNFNSISTGKSFRNIFLLEDQIVVRSGEFEVEIYDQNLTKQNTINLSDLITNEENLKNTILSIFTKDDQVYIAHGVSSVNEQNNFSLEVGVSIQLLVIDSGWNLTGNYTILDGVEDNKNPIWERYKLISQDVRVGIFAVFLFQNKRTDSKFEYLVKKVKLN